MDSSLHTLLARGGPPPLDQKFIDLGWDTKNIDTTSTNALYRGVMKKYCTVETCPVETWGTIYYRPNMAGNVIYLLCFLVLLIAQLYYGIRKKTWTYMAVLSAGILLEFIGYIGRIMLNQNPFIMNNFLT